MWIIDGTINLEQIAKDAKWHLQSTIEALTAAGLPFGDAENFAAFIFAEVAKIKDAGMKSTDYLTDAQWDRLSAEPEVVLTPEQVAARFGAEAVANG